jgi:Helicase HerA, central domain/TraM recognition site of TraD and TraG
MNAAESRILSVLRLGDMIRFVLRCDEDRKINVAIEGASASRGDGLLQDRLGLALREVRGNGYIFSERKIKRNPARKSGSKGARGTKDRWIEIRALSVVLSLWGQSGVGFGTGRGRNTGTILRLPDLPRSADSQVFESLSALISGVREIKALEIDFARVALKEDFVRPLMEAMRLHTVANEAIGPEFDQRSVPEIFLALWLSQRCGWRVNMRVLVEANEEIPVAALEMIGRDFFRCECEVVTERDVRKGGDEIDFANWFPRGWPFPPILPSPDSVDILAASRLHNVKLPQLPKEGLIIGIADGAKVRLPLATRDRHTYVVGATGTGKSTLLARMIREDIKRGEGVILLDPHGDLYKAALKCVPPHRRNEVFRLDPAMNTKLPGFNILDIPQTQFRRRHAAFLVGELFRFFEETWNMEICGGPAFEMYFRNTMLLLCLQGLTPELAAKPYNISAFAKVMSDKEFRSNLLANCPEQSVVQFWTEIAEKTYGDTRLENMVPYISSKINNLAQTGFVSDLVCARQNEFRIAERMQRGEIILINLNKGLLGAYESRLLGTLLMIEIFAAGLQRSTLPTRKRHPVNLYVDEFQNFVSDNVASMFSEARKFGLRLTVANQTLAQLRASRGRQDLLETVLGNVGNMILFRLGVPDSDRLRMFLEPFAPQEMQQLPNYHALVRLLTPEGPVRPVIAQTLPT